MIKYWHTKLKALKLNHLILEYNQLWSLLHIVHCIQRILMKLKSGRRDMIKKKSNF